MEHIVQISYEEYINVVELLNKGIDKSPINEDSSLARLCCYEARQILVKDED